LLAAFSLHVRVLLSQFWVGFVIFKNCYGILVLLVLPFFTLNSQLIAARLKPLLNRMARILVSCIPKQIALAELGGGSMNTAPGLQCSFTEGSFLCSHFVLCDSLSYWWK